MIELLTPGEILLLIVGGGPWAVGLQVLGTLIVDAYKLWLWKDLSEVEG
jgi:hypothetical protein